VRLTIVIDGTDAAKLSRLAERAGVEADLLAAFLLSQALEKIDDEPFDASALLDTIPGAHERALLGQEQGRSGEVRPLDDV
jgi:hypothetical protein